MLRSDHPNISSTAQSAARPQSSQLRAVRSSMLVTGVNAICTTDKRILPGLPLDMHESGSREFLWDRAPQLEAVDAAGVKAAT
eukprot:760179-Hanusia_phi.AAC.1